ncbi:hypothetical protein [Leifsonia sp. AG29]|uniref:hypothetical protein n=1 Tax=Leifsonia sp. AG29 TaxID=2598860 RepID=UPI00131E9A5A|nr:hypothetical protein [Leifsonia sp. AG29]
MSFWLPQLIDSAARAASDSVDETIAAIDEAVRGAARRMLDALLPPIVESQYLAIKSASWLAMEGATVAVTTTVAAANVGMALSGAVEKKVTEGLERIASDNEYGRGVKSIRP